MGGQGEYTVKTNQDKCPGITELKVRLSAGLYLELGSECCARVIRTAMCCVGVGGSGGEIEQE